MASSKMLSTSLASGLQKQVELESHASAQYLAMASWAECAGYGGSARFLYHQSAEERGHQLRIMRYLNERQQQALQPDIGGIKHRYKSLREAFESALAQEEKVSASIHRLSEESLKAQDYATFQFLLWFVEEQREEEASFRNILGLFDLWGEKAPGIGLLDKAVGKLAESKP